MPRRPLTPPPTIRDEKGRPRTKWDLLAEKEPPRHPTTVGHRGAGMTPMLGLSDEDAPTGVEPFVKRFR